MEEIHHKNSKCGLFIFHYVNIQNYFNKLKSQYFSQVSVRQIMNVLTTDVHMRKKLLIIPQNGKISSKMTLKPYKSFLNIYHHLNDIY